LAAVGYREVDQRPAARSSPVADDDGRRGCSNDGANMATTATATVQQATAAAGGCYIVPAEEVPTRLDVHLAAGLSA
jgi:hypothetical protein